jgi:hypothetical protein
MAKVFKGSRGEVLYPDNQMMRFWIDIALEKSNDFLNDSSGAFLSAFSPKFKDYKTNADIYFQEGKFDCHL